MGNVITQTAESLEKRGAHLFLVGSGLIVAFGLYNGFLFVTDATMNDWLYLTVLLGRLAVILGLAGLSVQIMTRNARLGKVSLAVVAVATIFTIVLLVLSVLEGVGVSTPVIGLFGLGMFVLTVLANALVGAAIIRTRAYSRLVGGLLLGATAVLIALFIGLTVLPTRLAGAVGEGGLAVLFFILGYRLLTGPEPGAHAGPTSEPTAP